MYYKGIGPEKGRRVPQEDAFDYALKGCRKGTPEEQENFLMLIIAADSMEEFEKDLVDWYFSGNWVQHEDYEDEYII